MRKGGSTRGCQSAEKLGDHPGTAREASDSPTQISITCAREMDSMSAVPVRHT